MFAKQVFVISNKAFATVVATRMQHNVALKPAAVNAEPTPVTFDVPWGKIEGKLWGSCEKQPILAVHGWMDNANSFDALIPHLPKKTSILAIDLPGHGLSSWLPRGTPYDDVMYTLTLRKIIKSLGWNKVKFLGHSMGAILCHNYTRVFPKEVEFVVSLDAMTFITDINTYAKRQAIATDAYIKLDEKVQETPPCYTEEMAIEKWLKGAGGSLDIPSAKILISRGAKRKEDGTYYFTKDSRVKVHKFVPFYPLDFLKEMASLVTCPYFVIRASNSPFNDDMLVWLDIIGAVRKNNSNCEYARLEGHHHVHLTNPELVAGHLNPFLEKYDV